MRTKFNAIAAVKTDLRFLSIVIPINSADKAGLLAVAAADAVGRVEFNASPVARQKGLGGTDPGAGRILTSSAGNDYKAFFHTSDRSHPQARFT